MSLCCEVLERLSGKTLVTAESLTGYTNWVKKNILGVSGEVLETYGAVSAQTAQAMARGVRELLKADVAVAVTGLAGPGGDDFGNPVGTVFIGYQDGKTAQVIGCHFIGAREEIRNQTIDRALKLVLENAK